MRKKTGRLTVSDTGLMGDAERMVRCSVTQSTVGLPVAGRRSCTLRCVRYLDSESLPLFCSTSENFILALRQIESMHDNLYTHTDYTTQRQVHVCELLFCVQNRFNFQFDVVYTVYVSKVGVLHKIVFKVRL
jgi:hypothetical protein